VVPLYLVLNRDYKLENLDGGFFVKKEIYYDQIHRIIDGAFINISYG
jgi:hypothetical protein